MSGHRKKYQKFQNYMYNISRITGTVKENDVVSYFVNWEPSWVSENQLVGCEDLINMYMNNKDSVYGNGVGKNTETTKSLPPLQIQELVELSASCKLDNVQCGKNISGSFSQENEKPSLELNQIKIEDAFTVNSLYYSSGAGAVNAIVGLFHGKDNHVYYRVEWKPTWEEESSLIGYDKIIKEFLKELGISVTEQLRDFSTTEKVSTSREMFEEKYNHLGSIEKLKLDIEEEKTKCRLLEAKFEKYSKEKDEEIRLLQKKNAEACDELNKLTMELRLRKSIQQLHFETKSRNSVLTSLKEKEKVKRKVKCQEYKESNNQSVVNEFGIRWLTEKMDSGHEKESKSFNVEKEKEFNASELNKRYDLREKKSILGREEEFDAVGTPKELHVQEIETDKEFHSVNEKTMDLDHVLEIEHNHMAGMVTHKKTKLDENIEHTVLLNISNGHVLEEENGNETEENIVETVEFQTDPEHDESKIFNVEEYNLNQVNRKSYNLRQRVLKMEKDDTLEVGNPEELPVPEIRKDNETHFNKENVDLIEGIETEDRFIKEGNLVTMVTHKEINIDENVRIVLPNDDYDDLIRERQNEKNATKTVELQPTAKNAAAFVPINRTVQSGNKLTLSYSSPKDFECKICSRKFTTKTRLQKHECHKMYFCKICPCKYTDKRILHAHTLEHFGKENLKCQLCSKPFTKKSGGHIRQHMMTHLGYKMFSCEICQKEFMQKKNLKNHMVCHTGLKKFKCFVCLNVFGRRDDLRYHISTKHNKLREEFRLRQYIADNLVKFAV